MLRRCAVFRGAFSASRVLRYEYPALGVTQEAADNARGEAFNSMYNVRGIKATDKDALRMTGNATVPVYDAETLYNPAACVAKDKARFAFFNGHEQYAIDPVTDKQVAAAGDFFERADKEAVWAALLKDYPSLKAPLDDHTRVKIMNLFEKAIDLAADEKAVKELSAPVVLQLLEEKHFHFPLWWRVAERLAEAMAVCGAGKYDTRTCYLVTERVTKIMLNTARDMPWASDDYTSPIFTDVCGTRQCTEAGMW